MPNINKIIEKMHNQPHGIRFDEAKKALEHYGYQHTRTKGSHYQFVDDDGDLITVKFKNPIREAYVKNILKRAGEEA